MSNCHRGQEDETLGPGRGREGRKVLGRRQDLKKPAIWVSGKYKPWPGIRTLSSAMDDLCNFRPGPLVPGLLVGTGPDNPPLSSSQPR